MRPSSRIPVCRIFFYLSRHLSLGIWSAARAAATSTFPKWPTRGVRTIDEWEFWFDDEDGKGAVARAEKIYTVTVPDAFDLPSVSATGKCKPECCERALGAHGDETCYTLKSGDILGGEGGGNLFGDDEDEEGAANEAGAGMVEYQNTGAIESSATSHSPSLFSSSNPRQTFDSCCSHATPFTHKRGVGVYRASVGGHITKLRFHACLLRCQVFVDGFLVAAFVSGYAPYDVDIGSFGAQPKKIVVKADNRFDPEKVPMHQQKYDWYQAGGLVRPVEAHTGNFLLLTNAVVSIGELRRTGKRTASSGTTSLKPSTAVGQGQEDSVDPSSSSSTTTDSQGVRWHSSLSDALQLPILAKTEEAISVETVDVTVFLDEAKLVANAGLLSRDALDLRLKWADRCGSTGGKDIRLEKVSQNIVVPGQDSESLRKLTFTKIAAPGNGEMWDLDSPQLHFLAISIHSRADKGGDLLDCIVSRFGLRTFEARDGRFYLNGKHTKLKGYNRHDAEPSGTGPAMSYATLYRDARMLKSVGANFIRGAHYPQDQRWLDLCDEVGILIWEESVGWQNTVADFQNPKFRAQVAESTRRMVFHSQNHPSVVIFGFLNEGHSSQEESKEIYDYLANDVIRKWDLGGRLVSWASSSRFHDVNWDNADFLSFNSYEGWYPTTEAVSVEALQTIPEIWDFSAAWAQDHFPGKPLICSETGAGGIFGMHGPSDGQKWTEEVQSVILQVHTLALTKHEKIAGFSLWQWSDSLIDRNTSDGLHRPRGLNNKGVMTLHRRPKTSFFAMRTIFKNDFWGLILPESDTGKFQDLIKVA